MKPIGPAPLRSGWGVERLHGGLVLRACLLLTAFSVCAHVYLERVRGGRASPAPLAAGAAHSGRPTLASHPGDGRPEDGTAGAPKMKDPSLSQEMEEGGEGRPQLRPQKKVNNLLLCL